MKESLLANLPPQVALNGKVFFETDMLTDKKGEFDSKKLEFFTRLDPFDVRGSVKATMDWMQESTANDLIDLSEIARGSSKSEGDRQR